MSLESALVMDVDFIVNDALKGYYVSDKVYTPFKSQVIRNFFAMLSINIGARYNEEPVAQELADILYKMNIRWQKPSIDLFDWVNSQCVSFGGIFNILRPIYTKPIIEYKTLGMICKK